MDWEVPPFLPIFNAIFSVHDRLLLETGNLFRANEQCTYWSRINLHILTLGGVFRGSSIIVAYHMTFNYVLS